MNRKLFDIFGKDASMLKQKKLWLFDMDGTIYNENVLFDGALKLFDSITARKGKYIFITNNSSKSLDDYIKKVKSLGISASNNNFFTSVQATVLYIKSEYPNTKVYCQGTKSMCKEFADSGLDITSNIEDSIGLVVVGFDTELTSEKLRNTCYLLSKGITFIATNCDLRCPVDFGFIPDCGSICQMITNATGRRPLFIGKPEATMIEYVMKTNGCSKEETVVVGDRLYTDIASGINAGVTSVCVLSGETTKDDIIDNSIKPSFVFSSIKDIVLDD